MRKLSQSFKLGLIILALTSLSACSSSKVEESGAPVETAGDPSLDKPAEAATDAVPPAPEALAATPDSAPAAEVPAAPGADPSLDAPAGDPASTASAVPPVDPALDAPVADSAVAPVADAPIADAPIADAPITPITDSAVASAPEPIKNSKHSKHAKHSKSKQNNTIASKGDGTGYRVKNGDTLMKIAFEQYGDLYRWKEIYEANRGNIKDPNHVPPGTELTLNGAGMVTIEKNGESYLIKHGDTLGVISNDVYGTIRKWKKLWENNRQLIKDPNKIYAGFYLYYQPEGKLTHDDVAPGLKKEDSAANAQKVSTARVPASVKTPVTTPASTTPAKN